MGGILARPSALPGGVCTVYGGAVSHLPQWLGDANSIYWVGSRDAKCPAMNGPDLTKMSSLTQNANIGMVQLAQL